MRGVSTGCEDYSCADICELVRHPRRRSSPTFCRHSCGKSYDELVAVVERTADELKTYTDAGATDVALLPLQTDPPTCGACGKWPPRSAGVGASATFSPPDAHC